MSANQVLSTTRSDIRQYSGIFLFSMALGLTQGTTPLSVTIGLELFRAILSTILSYLVIFKLIGDRRAAILGSTLQLSICHAFQICKHFIPKSSD